jgi:hypothetical protein
VLAIGSFHAVAKGVSVVCSGGNSGPYAQTVINTAPWVITVAASTIDREFPSTIILGNNQTIQVLHLYVFSFFESVCDFNLERFVDVNKTNTKNIYISSLRPC